MIFQSFAKIILMTSRWLRFLCKSTSYGFYEMIDQLSLNQAALDKLLMSFKVIPV